MCGEEGARSGVSVWKLVRGRRAPRFFTVSRTRTRTRTHLLSEGACVPPLPHTCHSPLSGHTRTHTTAHTLATQKASREESHSQMPRPLLRPAATSLPGRPRPPPCAAPASTPPIILRPGDPLPETEGVPDLAAIADAHNRVTIAGFGSLLSPTSAVHTFPDLSNFRVGRLATAGGGGDGACWRRVFAHTTAIFHARGVARPATREVASLSVEPAPRGSPPLAVSLFEVEATPAATAALVDREHEFRLLALPVVDWDGGVGAAAAAAAAAPAPRLAVVCAAWTDAAYRAARCPPGEWERRYRGTYPDGTPFNLTRVWDDAHVLPCRAYLRHCVLAARRLGPAAEACLLDNTLLADRVTVLRAWLAANPGIIEEEPPAELVGRYSG